MERKRDVRLDLGRCIAALLVVYVHVAHPYIRQYHDINRADWAIADIANTLGRVCVPLFIMMSGALLIGKPIDSWPAFMKKRAAATLKPYFFGVAVYFSWQASRGVYPPDYLEYLKQVVMGNGFLHLYFLYILLAMYIVTPILQGLERVSNNALIGTIAILFLLDIVDRHIGPVEFTLGYLALGNCMSYLPYFLSGYLLYRRRSISSEYALSGFLISSLLSALLCWLLTIHPLGPYTRENFEQYTSVTVIVPSLFAFNLLLKAKIETVFMQGAVGWLAEQSLGIYILHYVVTFQLIADLKPIITLPVGLAVMLYPAIGFALTAIIVWTLRLWKPLRGFI